MVAAIIFSHYSSTSWRKLWFVFAEMGRLKSLRTLEASPRNKTLDPHGPFLQNWNKILLVLCAFAMAWDALFFYIPFVDGRNNCLKSDQTLEITACVLRTITDVFYLGHILLQFRTRYVSPTSRGFGRGVLVEDLGLIARRYLMSFFIVDVLSVLPFPQMVVILPRFGGHGLTSKDLLKLVIFTQYAPRLFRVYPLYKQVTRTSGLITQRIWAGAALNLFLYALASHVFGAVWYMFSIDYLSGCWHKSCVGQRCLNAPVYCNNKHDANYTFSCSVVNPYQVSNSKVFDFGMFNEAIQSEILQSHKFTRKLSFCFWWGLRNLSSFGQNISSGNYIGDNLFAAFICLSGLILFSFLFGNIQKYLDSTTAKVEEMRLRRQDSEKWMSHRSLPEDLRRRIRKYEQYKWQETRGFDEETVISNLPTDLTTDIKRHLWNMCFDHIMRVPWFEGLNEEILDAMCDWLKPVFYMENSLVLREGQPVKEALFIMRGSLMSSKSAGDFNMGYLKAGDFCGGELFEWAANPRSSSSSKLPSSAWTVKSLTEVEAFALKPDALKSLMQHMHTLHGPQFKHIFRFYSQQWRTWAAYFIQSAWKRYRKRKLTRLEGIANVNTHAPESPNCSTRVSGSAYGAPQYIRGIKAQSVLVSASAPGAPQYMRGIQSQRVLVSASAPRAPQDLQRIKP